MRTYKIFNFYHNYFHPRMTKIGPFNIIVNNEHCKNLEKLPYLEHLEFFHEYNNDKGKAKHEFRRIPKKTGSWIETALVEIDDKDIEPSVIYFEESEKNNIDDLLLILSFLTGRRVCREEDRYNYIGTRCFNAIVDKKYFYRFDFDWKKLQNLRDNDFCSQFYNIVMSYEGNDALAMFVYANSTFNTIYESWFNKHKNEITGINKKGLNKIKKEVIQYLENSIFISAKRKLLKVLNTNDFNIELIEDISIKVGRALHERSAIFMMKYFLMEMGLYPKNDNTEILKRLKMFNIVRNSFIHVGDIPSEKRIKYSRKVRINLCATITVIVISIVQYYFAAQVFNINSNILNSEKNFIKKFFETGSYKGMNIFDETFEDYLQKIEKIWQEEGQLLWLR